MIVKTFRLILFFSSSQSKNLFMPNLPMGEYRVVYDKIYPCASTKNHSFQINWYLRKKISNIAEIKGNMTLLIPFDDTLTLDINFASWGSTGGWIPNSNIIIIKKTCSNLKYICGNAWFTVIKAINVPTDSCPVPPGTYITSGIDLKELKNNNFPKVYFYGKYKVVIRTKNLKNEVLSCVITEINLIRPWETPI